MGIKNTEFIAYTVASSQSSSSRPSSSLHGFEQIGPILLPTHHQHQQQRGSKVHPLKGTTTPLVHDYVGEREVYTRLNFCATLKGSLRG